MLFSSIFLVLPAYNEEKSLGALCENLLQYMDDSGRALRVLLVDDGSQDRTLAIARSYQKKLSIEIIEHSKNMGLGGAMRTGLWAALQRVKENEVIITMDADNSHPPIIMENMLKKLNQGREVVIASRYRVDSEIHGVTIFRQLMSLGAAALYKMSFPIHRVRDYTCGYRAYHPMLLQDAFTAYGTNGLIENDGFVCMVELLLKLRAMGAKMDEVPLLLRYDLKESASKMNIRRNVKDLLKLVVTSPRSVKHLHSNGEA